MSRGASFSRRRRSAMRSLACGSFRRKARLDSLGREGPTAAQTNRHAAEKCDPYAHQRSTVPGECRGRRGRPGGVSSHAMRRALAWVVLVALPGIALGDARRLPFWPDEVPAALQKRVDGAAVLDAV